MSMIQSHSNDEYVQNFFFFVLKINRIIIIYSRRNSNVKQWSIGKKRFNDHPKEVGISNKRFFMIYYFFLGYALVY